MPTQRWTWNNARRRKTDCGRWRNARTGDLSGEDAQQDLRAALGVVALRRALVLDPREGEAAAPGTNGGDERSAARFGELLRAAARRAGRVELREVDLVLTGSIVAPGEAEPLAVPGDIGAHRMALRAGDTRAHERVWM